MRRVQRMRCIGERAGADGDEQPIAGLPRAGSRARLAELARVDTDVLGDEAQRELAQRREVALAEEVLRRLAARSGT